MTAPAVPAPESIVVPGAPAPVADPSLATTRDIPSTNALSDAFAVLATSMAAHTLETPPDDPPAPPATPPAAPAPPAPPAAPAPVLDADGRPHDPATGQFVAPPPAGDPVAPPPAEAATDVGQEDIDPALIVTLMPRHADQAPHEIVVDTPETAERLRQSLNGAMRRDEFETALRAIEHREQQVERLEVGLMVDPLSVVTDVLDQDQLDQLLLVLLTDETIYTRLAPRLETLGDSLSRREARLDARDAYTAKRDEASTRVQQQRAQQQNIRQITRALDAIAPDHLTAEQAVIWKKDALRDLSVITKQHRIDSLDPMQIPTVLKARLVATGVDPEGALEKIARAVYGKTTKAGVPRGAGPSALPAAPAAGTPPPGQRPVAALRAAHERREAAAAVAGAGTGTPTAGGLPELPAGAGLDEALALVAGRFATRR